MDDFRREVQHLEPAWRSRSDFIIAAVLADPALQVGREQLWARRIGEREFELCCVPFFLYDVALGDIVETGVGDRAFIVEGVLRPSGRFVFRAWFGDSFQPRDQVVRQLAALGAVVEWSSTNLVAVDAADAGMAQQIADLLSALEHKGHLV